jgi:hypothetical protein
MATTLTPRARRAHSAGAHVAGAHVPILDVALSGEGIAAARASTVPSANPPQPDLAGHEERKRSLDVVRSAPKRTRLWRTRLVVVAPVLCVVSLLAVAGAQAVLTGGQVKLTKVQAEVSAAQTKRFDLELKIALEEQPSAVIAAARAQGMIVPSVIHDIPAVSIVEPQAKSQAHPKKQNSRNPSVSSKVTNGGSATNRSAGHP